MRYDRLLECLTEAARRNGRQVPRGGRQLEAETELFKLLNEFSAMRREQIMRRETANGQE